MSAEKMEQLSQTLHRLLVFASTAMLSFILYFVKDIHSDFKTVQQQVQEVRAHQQVQDAQIDFLTQSKYNHGQKN